MAPSSVDNKVETFLEVVDRREFVDEGGEFFAKVQGKGPK